MKKQQEIYLRRILYSVRLEIKDRIFELEIVYVNSGVEVTRLHSKLPLPL